MDYFFAPLWLVLTAGLYTGVLIALARPLLRRSIHLPSLIIRLIIYAVLLFISAIVSLYITVGIGNLLQYFGF